MASSAHTCWRRDDNHWSLRDAPACPQCRKRALECGCTEEKLAQVADARDRFQAALRGGAVSKTRAERFAEILVCRLVESRFPAVDPDAVRRELASWNLTALDPEQEQFFAEMRALFEYALEELDREEGVGEMHELAALAVAQKSEAPPTESEMTRLAASIVAESETTGDETRLGPAEQVTETTQPATSGAEEDSS